MPPQQPLATDTHETIIILPGGGIHAHDLLHNDPGAATGALIESVCAPLRAAASQQGRPIRLSIGHADGRVEHHLITVDGMIRPSLVPPAADGAVDPVWNQGIPEDTGLLDAVRAAHRAGQWRAAQQAALRASQHLIAQHGREHPYAAMGLELQAYFALMAGDRGTAAALYTEAAVTIHRLNGPPAQARQDLANAVATWIHSDRDIRPSGPGFATAHALVRVAPHDQAALAALLHRLADDHR